MFLELHWGNKRCFETTKKEHVRTEEREELSRFSTWRICSREQAKRECDLLVMTSVFLASQSSSFFSLFAQTDSPSGKPALRARIKERKPFMEKRSLSIRRRLTTNLEVERSENVACLPYLFHFPSILNTMHY